MVSPFSSFQVSSTMYQPQCCICHLGQEHGSSHNPLGQCQTVLTGSRLPGSGDVPIQQASLHLQKSLQLSSTAQASCRVDLPALRPAVDETAAIGTAWCQFVSRLHPSKHAHSSLPTHHLLDTLLGLLLSCMLLAALSNCWDWRLLPSVASTRGLCRSATMSQAALCQGRVLCSSGGAPAA